MIMQTTEKYIEGGKNHSLGGKLLNLYSQGARKLGEGLFLSSFSPTNKSLALHCLCLNKI